MSTASTPQGTQSPVEAATSGAASAGSTKTPPKIDVPLVRRVLDEAGSCGFLKEMGPTAAALLAGLKSRLRRHQATLDAIERRQTEPGAAESTTGGGKARKGKKNSLTPEALDGLETDLNVIALVLGQRSFFMTLVGETLTAAGEARQSASLGASGHRVLADQIEFEGRVGDLSRKVAEQVLNLGALRAAISPIGTEVRTSYFGTSMSIGSRSEIEIGVGRGSPDGPASLLLMLGARGGPLGG